MRRAVWEPGQERSATASRRNRFRSRVVAVGEKEYTIGVLVQSNFGATLVSSIHRRQTCGREILAAADGREDPARPFPSEQARAAVKNSMFRGTEEDRGSIMMICATDLPLSERQLRRLIRRMCNGLARTGSYTGHGSGEVMIGFTTANRVPTKGSEEKRKSFVP